MSLRDAIAGAALGLILTLVTACASDEPPPEETDTVAATRRPDDSTSPPETAAAPAPRSADAARPADPEPGAPAVPALATGRWRAWLECPGGDLPFHLDVETGEDGARIWIVNGPERILVPRTVVGDGAVELAFDHYDARIRARVGEGGARLEGAWTKTTGPGTEAALPFSAEAGDAPRFPEGAAPWSDFSGTWRVDFSSSEDPAVGRFEMDEDGTARGTFLTTTGDYRYLAGRVDGRTLWLSCFDGAHAFLFKAELQGEDVLHGDFWSRDSWHESWTALRDDAAALPDPFYQTTWTGVPLAELSFPDLEGRPRSLADPAFAGRVLVLHVFGTWCPNCHDATDLMVELHEEYGPRGLSVIGLAFELTGDFERDAGQVRRYAEKHGASYPMLVAGPADKKKATESFRALDFIRSYPTTVFLTGDGRIRAVHSGFAGPATGADHEALRREFVRLIESDL